MSDLPTTHVDPLTVRQPDHPIEDQFLRRVSWRALTPEVSRDQLHQCLEAARWTCSTYNEQEWRFLYAMAGTDEFDRFFGLLAEGNQPWCKNAGVLLAVCSTTKMSRNGNPNPVHAYDAGAAAFAFGLQASASGLVAHQMVGFDKGRARVELKLPDDVEIHAMVALGGHGDPTTLDEGYRELETPNDRKPIAEISCEGVYSL